MSLIQTNRIQGDCRQELYKVREKSVHLIVTSPPYWGLRSYLPADHPLKPLEIGSEPTVELYIEHMMEVFRACHHVLRDDGTMWVNLGDCYNAYNHNRGPAAGVNQNHHEVMPSARPGLTCEALKPKDLCMVPFRVAIAAQAQGWYLRSVIPWIKRNCMPESVTDRPATAVEYVFLFSKSEDYFYDRHAVMQPASGTAHARGDGLNPKAKMPGPNSRVSVDRDPQHAANPIKQNRSFSAAVCSLVSHRNRRNSDWLMESWQGLLQDDDGDPMALIVNTKGTNIAHFAAYPPKLVEPIIKAGTSEKGCCPECGAPWVRIVEKNGEHQVRWKNGADCVEEGYTGGPVGCIATGKIADFKTTGWKPSCECNAGDPIPCTVLDPFHGTGCTEKVATDLGRSYTGCELNPEYLTFDRNGGQRPLC